VEMALDAPDSAWDLKIQRVYRVDQRLVAVGALVRKPGIGASVITRVGDAVTVAAPASWPVTYYVTGKTWHWDNAEPYVFLQDIQPLKQQLRDAELVFSRSQSTPTQQTPARLRSLGR